MLSYRQDFPILKQSHKGQPLVYLDNAATTQKPQIVIDAISKFYEQDNSNVHRAVHTLAERATSAYEAARTTLAKFINAERADSCVFVRGTTEAINLCAYALEHKFKAGDTILVGEAEHHANLVPWLNLAKRTGAKVQKIPLLDDGEYCLNTYKQLLNDTVRLVAVAHISNVLGTVHPVKQMTELAHKAGANIIIDGAQAPAHLQVDVQDIGADFYAFGSHKMYGPFGAGLLYIKHPIENEMQVFQTGGEMIEKVSFDEVTYRELPYRYEPGTPNIPECIAMAVAAEYITQIGYMHISSTEQQLLVDATEKLSSIDGLTIYGTAPHKAAIVAFNLEGVHAHDLGTLLDNQGIAVRVGHHCCQPLMARFGISSCARASFSFYNTFEEVDRLYDALVKIKGSFGG